MHIASLHVYPVKGARGISLDQADLLASGIRHDRRFMVVDANGTFLTQREEPRLALVEVAVTEERLALHVAGSSATIDLPPLARERARRHVRVWDDEVAAVDVGGASAELFSDLIGRRCSLVFMPPDVVRPVDPAYARPGDRVGFADGFPVLVASLASLADLNARLVQNRASPSPMDRFRPNIVVEGGEPFAEEGATAARIELGGGTGTVRLRMPKRCARCQVTTVDQRTAETGKEPLRTLASYRTVANKVNFAMNAIPDLPPDVAVTLRVGSTVTYE